jgi:hypothetical protein
MTVLGIFGTNVIFLQNGRNGSNIQLYTLGVLLDTKIGTYPNDWFILNQISLVDISTKFNFTNMSHEEDDFLLELYGQPNQPTPAPIPVQHVEPLEEDEDTLHQPHDPLQKIEATSDKPLISQDDDNEDDEVPLVYKQETPNQTTKFISLSVQNQQDANAVSYEETRTDAFSGENFVQIFQFGPKIDVTAFTTDLDHLEDKPWRNPGSNLADYFNYGFNEETWRMYCAKQTGLKEEFKSVKKHREVTPDREDDRKKRDRDDYKSSRHESSSRDDDYRRRRERDDYDDKYKREDRDRYDDKYKHDERRRNKY